MQHSHNQTKQRPLSSSLPQVGPVMSFCQSAGAYRKGKSRHGELENPLDTFGFPKLDSPPPYKQA